MDLHSSFNIALFLFPILVNFPLILTCSISLCDKNLFPDLPLLSHVVPFLSPIVYMPKTARALLFPSLLQEKHSYDQIKYTVCNPLVAEWVFSGRNKVLNYCLVYITQIIISFILVLI